MGFNKLSLRYKLLNGFFLVWFLFVFFAIYLLFTFNKNSQLLTQLDRQADRRTIFVTLHTNTEQLSDAIKSYILTHDPKWEKAYDKTSIDLQTTLADISTNGDVSETKDLTTFKDTVTRLQGVELLILAKTKEGNTAGAIGLFDSNYIAQQSYAATLVTRLVNHEDMLFDQTLVENGTTLITAKNVIAITVVLVLLFIVCIGLYFAFLVENSIKKLVTSVNKIATGDLQERIPIVSHDEIGKLAESFNSMAARLQESYSGLEQKIREKTKELSEKVDALETAEKKLQIANDMTEAEKAKDEAILSSVGEGMIFTGLDAKIVLMNKAAEEILGLSFQKVLGKTVSDAFPLADEQGNPLNANMRPIAQTLSTKTRQTKTVVFLREDNQKILLALTTTPVLKEQTLLGAIEIIRDITKEKEVDRMKTEFISLASHQLRTPLSAIKWFSEMLVGGDAGELTSEQKDMAQNISDSTERMIELVNSLLNISRIESGRIMVDPKPTDLKELIEAIIKELQVKITQKQQNLVVSVHEGLPKITLDPKLIRQVYMNLLTNAIKYTPKGGDISVFISKKDDDVISQVTDNGYGIPKSEQSKIFQKFFRAANVAKVETDGTGLGLYLIKAIIESSHGKLWFESEENKGTTFWFSLPMSGMEAKKGEVTLDE